jgi:hypothetical protein
MSIMVTGVLVLTGDTKFDPLPALVDLQPAAPSGRSRWDIWNRVRERSAASSTGAQVGAGCRPPVTPVIPARVMLHVDHSALCSTWTTAAVLEHRGILVSESLWCCRPRGRAP